jgi:hypothetical protein
LGVALGATLVFMLLAAGSAMAANVGVSGTPAQLQYSADADKENNVSVDQLGDGSFTVTSTDSDPLVDVDGVGGCQVVANVATCTPASSITADVGDRDDTVTLAASVTVPAELSGGDGVDTLTGGNGNDTLRIRGGGAGDSAICRDGNDTVALDLDDVTPPADCEQLDYPPQTNITAGPPDVVGQSTGLVYEFTKLEPTDQLRCRLSGPSAMDVDPCNSPLQLQGQSTPSLPDGKYTFQITSQDAFGFGPSATRTFTVDTIAPQVIVTRLSPTDASTAHFQLDAVDMTTVTLECRVGTAATAPCANIFSTPALPDGDYVLSVKGTDAAGNSSTADVPFTIKKSVPPGPPVQPRRIIIESLVLISGRPVKMSRRGVVTIGLQCAGTKKCTGRMTITTAEPVNRKRRKLERLGSTRFSIAANKKRRVKVRFSKRKAKLARRLKRFKAKVVITEIDQRGNKRISSRVFVLRAR